MYKKQTYIFQDALTGLYKIGKSANPKKRFKNIKAYAPGLKIVDICNIDIENYLHKYFKQKRVANEWFELTNEDMIWIRYYMAQVNLKYLELKKATEVANKTKN